MGFSNVRSLKTGLRGWNDYEIPLVLQDGEDPVIEANADKYFTLQVSEDQFKPKKLKQGLRNIFFCHMQDLIWYIDILFCILIHHLIPL